MLPKILPLIIVTMFGLVMGLAQAQPQQACGTVFLDNNGNGRLDPGEPGVANVMVSNQRQVVLSDGQGRYRLPVADDCVLFITKPAGYRLPVNKQQLPQFYYIHRPQGSAKTYYPGCKASGALPDSINFPLLSGQRRDHFKVIVVADPQPETLTEVGYIARDFVEELIGTDAQFGIVLGDIMFDRLELFKFYNSLIAQIGIPFFNVSGNHDVNYDASDDAHSNETFISHFGPPYYSFDYGQVHFVVLDNIHFYRYGRQKEHSGYKGQIGTKQLEWLKNDLAHVGSDKLVVLTMHIPLYTDSGKGKHSTITDRNELFELLQSRQHLLALAGHTHTHEHHFLGKEVGWSGTRPLHHVVSVTLCGSWWSGAQDDRQVAIADQRDGVPNGYQIFEFSGNTYKSRFKAAGKPADLQMFIHSPVGMVFHNQVAQTEVVVNVFDSSSRSQVFYRLDHGQFQPMKNIPMTDPKAAVLFSGKNSSAKPWVRPVRTRHIWSAPLPDDLKAGIHTITVKTHDQYGNVFSQSRIFVIW